MLPITKILATKSYKQRVAWIQRAFLITIFIILVRALYLQVIERPALEERAVRQWNHMVSLKPQRGPIYDTNGKILAVSLPMYSIFAVPSEIENPIRTARKLSRILPFEEKLLLKKLSASVSFIWLQRNSKPTISEKIERAGLKGIHLLKEYQRFYPQGNHAAQLVGFSGTDSQGLEGLEYRYNKHLMDNTPFSSTLSYLTGQPRLKTLSGGSLTLTIHSKLQYFTEKELSTAVNYMNAKHGVAIIMESQTGNILTMANIPDFDPNNFDRFNKSTYFNRAVSATYEPGSTFKIITMASALETNSVEKDNIFFCEDGEYQIQDRVIHDIDRFGWLPLEKIVQMSSNICAAKIAQRIPRPVFYKMIREFGFGTKTGIELPGEATGKVYNYQDWSETDIATISFGHTISATPLQVLTAINSIATGGVLIKPRIIKNVKEANGKLVNRDKQQRIRILKEDVANTLKKFMISVTNKGGTGYRANISGMTIAGKTGTTRKFDFKKREYSTKNHIVSFVGFFPAEKPVLTILVVIDEPQKKYLNSKSAAPIFKKIAEQAIQYYPGSVPVEEVENKGEYVKSEIFRPINSKVQKTAQKSHNTQTVAALIKGKTLREVIQIANREDLSIKTKGSGKAKSSVTYDQKTRSYLIEFR